MPEPIDPGAIPGADLDPAAIRDGARGVESVGADVSTQGATVVGSWQGLTAHYRAPEAETLFGVLDPVRTKAEQFGTDLGTVRNALVAFADEVEPIKAELDRIRAEAQTFVDTTVRNGVTVERPNPGYTAPGTTYAAGYNPYAGGATAQDFSPTITEHKEWHEDQASVDRNNDLIAQVNEQVVRLWEAERRCANAIYDVIGHPHIEAATDANPDGYGVDEIPEGAETPWGQPVEKTENCGESVVSGVKGFVWDGIIVGGIWGTVEGLGALTLGYNPATGEFFSGDVYGAAWSNLGMLAVGLVGNASGISHAMRFADGPVADFFAAGDEALVNAGKGIIAWDQWAEDPAAAAGTSVFNIATIIIPAGAAVSGVKAGASTASSAIRTAAAVMDVVDPAALAFRGGGAAVRVTAPVISDVLAGLDLGSLTRGVDTPSVNIPHIDIPATQIDVPSGAFDVPPVRDTPSPVEVREPELAPVGGGRGPEFPDGSTSPSPSGGTTSPGAGTLPDPVAPGAVPDPVTPGGTAPDPVAPAGAGSGDVPGGSGADGPGGKPPPEPPGGGVGTDGTPPREWTPEDGDPSLSDAESGDGWTRGPDQRGNPVDPDYGQPRPDHGVLDDRFAPPSTIPDDVAHLVRDPDAPFGRDANGDPYTREQWQERYIGPDNRPIYPGNDGAVPGSRIEFTDLDEFRNHYGDLVDRMGGPNGDFFSFPDTPFEYRALPGSNLDQPYSVLRFTDDLPDGLRIEVSEVAPAFGQPGGGLQVRILDGDTPVPMSMLEEAGIVERVGSDAGTTPAHGVDAVPEAGGPTAANPPGGAGLAPDLETTFVRGEESGWAGVRPGGRPEHLEDWVGYQEHVAGVTRDLDGALPEWHQVTDHGHVKFDGHGWEGQPPTEVFLEAKHGHRWLSFAELTDPRFAPRLNSLMGQLERQLEALPDGAVLRWHVSDEYGAAGLRRLFAEQGYGPDVVEVVYTPMR